MNVPGNPCSAFCENFIRAVLNQNWPLAFQQLDGLSMYEMLRGMAALDPEDFRDLLASRSAAGAGMNLPRIDYAAQVVRERRVPGTTPGDLVGTMQVHEAYMFVDFPSPLVFQNDLTGLLPAAGSPGKLNEADYQRAGTALGVEAAAIHAVAKVESGGRSGFGPGSLPVIRYELHIFHRETDGMYDESHPHLSQKTLAAGKPYHNGTQVMEYSLLYGAMILRNRAAAAVDSASWGMFQIMGFNHSGSPDVWSFVSAMFESEAKQLDAFLAFCRAGNLVRYLKARDWASFAAGYNGTDFKTNHYDSNLASAYAQYS